MLNTSPLPVAQTATRLLAELGARVQDPPWGGEAWDYAAGRSAAPPGRRYPSRYLRSGPLRAFQAEPAVSGVNVIIVDGVGSSSGPGALDPVSLSAANERLVVAHLPFYGTRGPLSQQRPVEALLTVLSDLGLRQTRDAEPPIGFRVPLVSAMHGTLRRR